MRYFAFFIPVLLLSCGQNPSAKKEIVKTDTPKQIIDTAKTTAVIKEAVPVYVTPDEGVVNAMLAAKTGNKWHVLNDKEATWMKDAFDYFIVPKRKEIPNYPYITKGDFNADGKQDIAAVVTDSLKLKYQVAIILGEDKIIFWDEDVLEDAALTTIAKTVVEGMDGEKTKKVKLKGDGINVEYFEKASYVIYWDRSSFKKIQTGD